MVPMGHARARDSNTGDDRGNLETQLKNLAQFGPSDECIFQDVAIGRSVPGTRGALHLLRLKSAQSNQAVLEINGSLAKAALHRPHSLPHSIG